MISVTYAYTYTNVQIGNWADALCYVHRRCSASNHMKLADLVTDDGRCSASRNSVEMWQFRGALHYGNTYARMLERLHDGPWTRSVSNWRETSQLEL